MSGANRPTEGTSRCPMCGAAGPHEHSGVEIAIYNNGIKAGRAKLTAEMGAPIAWTGSLELAVVTNKAKQEDEGRWQLDSYYIPLFKMPVEFKPWERRSSGEPSAEARMAQAYPAVAAFFEKYALGPKLCPSCLVCGQTTPPESAAITHLELPGIVVCARCRNGALPGLSGEPSALHCCEWREDADGVHHTACGEMFSFSDGTPAENKASYCQYCGGRLAAYGFIPVPDEPEDPAANEGLSLGAPRSQPTKRAD